MSNSAQETHWLVGIFWKVLTSSLWLMILASALGWFARGHFINDLFNHFRPYFLIAALLLPILIFLRSAPRLKILLLAVLIFALNAPFLLPTKYAPAPPLTEAHEDARIMQVNLLLTNPQYEQIADLIRSEKPDIIGLQEYSPEIDRGLRKHLSDYTLHGLEQETPFRTVIAEKIGLREVQIWQPTGRGIPTLVARLPFEGGSLRLLFPHPLPPIGSDFFENRNLYLAEIAEQFASESDLLLIGDLNITQYSPIYRSFASRLRLRNAVSGWQTTWPADRLPVFQIDHIMWKGRAPVRDCRRGPHIGSDHRPIICTLAIPGKGRAAIR